MAENICDTLWQQLGDVIARIVYESEEENKEKAAVIYRRDDKLIMGDILTGTEVEVKGVIPKRELGDPVGSFHTHPAEFFVEEEPFLDLVGRKPGEGEIGFTVPDLISAFIWNEEFICVVGDGFTLHCLTGIRKSRKTIKAEVLLDIIRKRVEANQRICLEDAEKLGLNYCKRDISQAVYKVAREAKGYLEP